MIHKPSVPSALLIDVFLSHTPGIRSAACFACLAVLAEKGQATIAQIGERLKLSRDTTNKALLALVDGGFVEVQRAGFTRNGKIANIYRIKP